MQDGKQLSNYQIIEPDGIPIIEQKKCPVDRILGL